MCRSLGLVIVRLGGAAAAVVQTTGADSPAIGLAAAVPAVPAVPATPAAPAAASSPFDNELWMLLAAAAPSSSSSSSRRHKKRNVEVHARGMKRCTLPPSRI